MLGDGMTAEAEAQGTTIDLQATRTETDVAGQLAIAETMLENKYNALILSPLTNDNLIPLWQQQKLMVFLSSMQIVSTSLIVIHLSAGFKSKSDTKRRIISLKKSAAQVKSQLLKVLPEHSHPSSVSTASKKKMAADYPDIEIVASVPADYEVEKGMNVATDILTQNPDIDAIYCCNDNMALGTVEALRAQNL